MAEKQANRMPGLLSDAQLAERLLRGGVGLRHVRCTLKVAVMVTTLEAAGLVSPQEVVSNLHPFTMQLRSLAHA